MRTQRALDTIKNKLFRSSPNQWSARPYGVGMNFEDAMQVLRNEFPSSAEKLNQMSRRMRGFHILMNKYGENAEVEGARDLRNLLRNTNFEKVKEQEESPVESIVQAAVAKGE